MNRGKQMKRSRRRASLLLPMLAIVLVFAAAVAGCGVRLARPGATVTQTERIEQGGAESVEVNVQGGVGELVLGGGAADLFAGEFRYNLDDLAVEVDYTVSDGEGVLTIQPEADNLSAIPTGEVVSEWDLQFAEGVPLDMDVNLGLGSSELDFSDLTLTGLEIDSGAGKVTVNVGRQTLERVEFQAGLGEVNFNLPGGRVEHLDFRAGAGDVEVDLTGDWETDLDASIEAGLGELTVRLPEGVGVRVEVEQGLGDVDTVGLTMEDGAYVNDAYGDSEFTLQIDIEQGAGDLNLSVE